MTNRLYYDAAISGEFDGTVVRVEPRGDGRQAVWLDRTTFYPTSGGQPFDTGWLNAARVVDVLADDAGEMWHLVEGAFSEGQSVHGRVDWPRRFDHMQQHTGQHVLSAAFVRLFGAKTISFHMGIAVSTVDLDREATPDEIARAEDEANRVVWEDRPVTIRYASAEEAAALPLRKAPKRTGRLRLIDVQDFDLSACGGTHVSRTGALGLIAVSAWERFKGGQRLEFVCGGRALTKCRELRDITTRSGRLLSTLPPDLPAAVERLQAEIRDHKRALAAIQIDVARYQAQELMASAEAHRLGSLVLSTVDGDAVVLKALATTITATPGFTVVLVSRATPALVVAARSADVACSCHDLVKAMMEAFGGRGGGKPDLAQGGGFAGTPAAILDYARASLA